MAPPTSAFYLRSQYREHVRVRLALGWSPPLRFRQWARMYGGWL